MDLSQNDIESYKLDLINQINKYRSNHGSNKLINDIKIDKISQQFATKLSKTGVLDYSSNEYKNQILGETVYKSENYFAPLKLAKALYDEISEYDFKSKDPEPNNFTQMVWKDTEFIGFGMAKSKEGKYFYVINYFPTGNVDGEFKKNVFPKGTKVKNEKIIKNNSNDSDGDKYVVKKILKVISTNNNDNDFDKEIEEFNKQFDDLDIDNNNKEVKEFFEDININKKQNKEKKKDNRKNILAELIKNKKEEISKEKNIYEKNKENKNIDNSVYNSFCIEALESHNKYRKMHHVSPLTLNKEICSISENYAKTLANELKCLQHSDNIYKGDELGENLYCCYGMKVTGQAVSKHWYDEIKKYNFNGDWQSGCGYFTQMIWKDTKEVGFGSYKDKGGKIYIVANYYPAGNYVGFFKYNVLKI